MATGLEGLGNYLTFRPQPYAVNTGPSALFGRTPTNPGVIDWQALRSLSPSAPQQLSLFEQSALPSASRLATLPPPPAAVATVAPEAAAAAEGGLMSRLPGFLKTGASRGLNSLKGLGIGQGLNVGGHLIGERLLGDNMSNNSDPTDWKQAYVRGMAGGGTLGGFAGPQGALLGAVGGGIGNAAGFALNDLVNGDAPGDSHLGNVPLIGAAFGGGSATAQRDFQNQYGVSMEDLQPEVLKAKLDSFNFSPEKRAQVRDSFNADAEALRKAGKSNEEAMAETYKKYFMGQNGQPSPVDAYKQQTANAPAAGGMDPATEELGRKALAMQALIAQIAPQIFQTNQAPDMSLYNGLMNDSIANLPASAQAWAQKSQADANARAAQSHNDTVGLLAVLPSLLTQQVASSYHDNAVQDAIALRRAELAAQAQGSNGGQDLTSLGG